MLAPMKVHIRKEMGKKGEGEVVYVWGFVVVWGEERGGGEVMWG